MFTLLLTMTNTATTSQRAIAEAVTLAGGQAELGRRVNESRYTINNWLKRGTPAEKCPAVELAVEGRVPCERLCAEEQWVRVADPRWPHPDGRPALDLARAAMPCADHGRRRKASSSSAARIARQSTPRTRAAAHRSKAA